LALAVVRDLREQRSPRTDEELADDETDLLAGFVLARASAGLADGTIRNDTNHLELIRDWFDRPLWEMQPADADAYFGKVLRDAKLATRTGRAGGVLRVPRAAPHRRAAPPHRPCCRVPAR
jgi:integrase/recombinase XerD